MDWSWLSDNLTAITHNAVGYVLKLFMDIINVLFDGVDGLISMLPSGSLFSSVSIPPGAGAVLNSLNYFFDVSRMAVSLAAVVSAHLALVVVVGVLRFFQVMK